MRIHTFIKRCDRQQIVAYGVFNAAEIRELERQGYRRTHVEEVQLPMKRVAENKNGIPMQQKRGKAHETKRDTVRSRGRTRRAR